MYAMQQARRPQLGRGGEDDRAVCGQGGGSVPTAVIM
jgi:hypothetical protein